MKTKAIIRIALYSLGILILSTILVIGVAGNLYGFESHHYDGAPLSAESTSLSSDKIRNLEIEWASGSISIIPSDEADTIVVRESEVDEDYRMVCKVSDDTLTIQFCKSSRNFISFGNIESKDLVIRVPSGWFCNDLEIETASADVEIVDMTIGNLDFDGASGRCNLENCNVNKLDVDVASGDLTFSGVLDSLDFDGASADCKLNLRECPSHINLDGMSGKLDITLPSDCGFTVSTEGLSSNFSTDFKTTYRNGIHSYGDGRCKIEVDAMSGSVSIHDSGESCHGSHHSSHH